MPVESLTCFHDIADFQHYFPKWDWIPPPSFPWKSSFNPETPLRSYASLTNQQWLHGLDFFHKIAWHQNPAKKTAFVELAFYAWDAGWRFQGIPEKVAAYSTFLRKVCNQACKLSHELLVPGDIISINKSAGKTLPSGYIDGCWPNIPVTSLKKLAIHCLANRSQSLAAWDVAF